MEWFFNNLNNYRKNGFDTIRLVPEIKIYVRYKLEDWEPEKEQRKKVLVSKKRRFYKSILKWTFLFELNPLDIWQNESNELNQYRKKLKEVNDYYIISVDVWENELATVWIYDKNKNPINIKYKNKEWSIIETNVFNATNMFVWKEWLEERQKDDKQAKYKKFVSLFNQILYASTNIDSIIEKMQKWEKFDNTFFKWIEGMKTEFWLISTWKDSGKFDFFDITTNCTHFKNWIADFLNKKSEEYLNISEDSENKWGICKNKLEKELDFPQINPVLKDAFWSDFLWILNYLFNHFLENGKFCFFVFENLYKWSSSGKNKVNKKYTNTGSNEWDKLNVKLWTYVWLYFLHYIFNYYTKVISYGDNGIYINQYIYNKWWFDKSLKSLWESKYLSNWLLIFVDERYTSQACPVCNNSLYLKPDNEIKCLVWHNKDWKLEEMHHADESDGCDYNMQTKTYWFDYLSSGDDLATHNIAKKWNEYFQSDDFIKTSEPKNEKQGSAFTNNRDSSYKMSGNINISHS